MRFTVVALVVALGLANKEFAEEKASFEPRFNKELGERRREGNDDEGFKYGLRREGGFNEERNERYEAKEVVPVRIVRVVVPAEKQQVEKKYSERREGKREEAREEARATKEYSKEVVKTALEQLEDQQKLLQKANKKAINEIHEAAERKDRDDEKEVKVVYTYKPERREEVRIKGDDDETKEFSKRVIKTDLYNLEEQQERLQKANVKAIAGIHEEAEAKYQAFKAEKKADDRRKDREEDEREEDRDYKVKREDDDDVRKFVVKREEHIIVPIREYKVAPVIVRRVEPEYRVEKEEGERKFGGRKFESREDGEFEGRKFEGKERREERGDERRGGEERKKREEKGASLEKTRRD